MRRNKIIALIALSFLGLDARGGVGDPQIKTDHPYYPGELAISDFQRLFEEQARQYRAATKIDPQSDHDKALASWYWRNTHYAHGEEGPENLWGKGFTQGDLRTREYWTGLFAHGFGLCGTTHSQWTAEMNKLLGHGRGRGVGVSAHNAFEVFLSGGAYGAGKWALLDHDISTIIFDPEGKSLLSIPEIKPNVQTLTRRDHAAAKQNGWLVCGLHPNDGAVYSEYNVAEYLAGYASVPPIVHLRRGEKLRRYLSPGLEDGATFVFWGRNYNAGGIPGPERSLTWVNQPEKMFGSREGTPYKVGQARYGNAVYTYTPNFANGAYKEGVANESNEQVTFEFYSPYIIGATPPNDSDWGIYDRGGRNGLVLAGSSECDVHLSTDQGASWIQCGPFRDGTDLTDHVKGYRQFLLRFNAGANQLAQSKLTIRTVCQANPAVMPQLTPGRSTVTFASSGRAVLSVGPTKQQAAARIVAGAFDSPEVILKLETPRGEPIRAIYAASHNASGNPPDPSVKYHIDYSTDDGRTWTDIVKDWTVPRHGQQPPDFWSQSFCYGDSQLENPSSAVLVRFQNGGGRKILRAEAHLTYSVKTTDRARATFAWRNSAGLQQESRVLSNSDWTLATGADVQTRWVELEPVTP